MQYGHPLLILVAVSVQYYEYCSIDGIGIDSTLKYQNKEIPKKAVGSINTFEPVCVILYQY